MIPRIVLAALIYQPTAEISGYNQIAAVHKFLLQVPSGDVSGGNG